MKFNHTLTTIAAGLVLSLGAQGANPAGTPGKSGHEIPLIGNALQRGGTSLNGEWHYIVDVQEQGYYDYRMRPTNSGFFRNAKPQRPEDLIEYDFDKAATMHVPGDWNTQDPRLFFYEGTVWYMRRFNYSPKADKRTLLYFGAVNYETRVWVNGKEAGYHVGGFTPFNFDVTGLLNEGENVVILKVDNKRHADAVPTLIFDWWNYGGITRDVLLIDLEPNYVENYRFTYERNGDKGAGTISFSASLKQAEAGREVTLRIPELKIEKTLSTGEDGSVALSLKAKPELWCPENPKLYAVEIESSGETIRDEVGFRTIETRGKQILLNGKPIFLCGVSIHEERTCGGGRANGTEDARTLLNMAKNLGCNYVRLAHYPHNEWMVREAERMGILVWSEIPCYWTIDWTNSATFDNAAAQLREMISRDRNRANVIIWSIANETPHSPERDAFLGKLADLARAYDPTRLISMAMEITGTANHVNRVNDNMHGKVDIVSFNEYIGWYAPAQQASLTSWEIPYDKPVIVSEFGGGAQYGYHGPENQRWTEEFQEMLYRENIKMIEKIDGLAGTTPWILKDFRSPRRVLDGIQDYYNRKGLYSDHGEEKLAAKVLREWYQSKKESYK